MKRFALSIATCIYIHTIATSALASSLEGSDLDAYSDYCPTGDYRAVWAEQLQGHLLGWVYLVCLNENLQETSYWYVTPDMVVQAAENTVLPEPNDTRQFVTSELSNEIALMLPGEFIDLLLRFKIVEPDLTPEQFGAPAGVVGGASGSGGSDVPSETTYTLNGEEVTKAEYDAWDALYSQAVNDMNIERDRLVEQQTHLALYALVDANQWHEWLDIDAINADRSEQAVWLNSRMLIIKLDDEQARSLLQTGPEFLTNVEKYGVPTTDSGDGIVPTAPQLGDVTGDQVEPDSDETADNVTADEPNELDESDLSNTTVLATQSAIDNGGGLGSTSWIQLLMLLFATLSSVLNKLALKYCVHSRSPNQPFASHTTTITNFFR